MRARWKRGVAEVDGGLGEAAGKLYVARNFKPEAKARIDELIRNLREAYRIGIDSLEWMTPEHQGARQGEARAVHREDRLPGQVARLLDARRSAATISSATSMRARTWAVRRHGRRSSASRSTARAGG